MNNQLNQPYKNRLVSFYASENEKKILKEKASLLPQVSLSNVSLANYELITNGSFSPVNSFMDEKTYNLVLDKMELKDGTFWPVPVLMDISEQKYNEIKKHDQIALTDGEGFHLAIMNINSIWPVNTKKEMESLFNKKSNNSQGVKQILNLKSRYYVGGEIIFMESPNHYDFNSYRHTPKKLRDILQEKKWFNASGFYTRNPIHRLQFETCLNALKTSEQIVINQITGQTHPMDFDRFTRVRATEKIMDKFPVNTTKLNILPVSLSFNPLRDILTQAIVSKNHGLHNLILNLNGFSSEINNKEVSNFTKEIEINFIHDNLLTYDKSENKYLPSSQTDNEEAYNMTNELIRKKIKKGERIPEWASFPEVINEIEKTYPPPAQQGFTVFITGLPSAGKSTIAKVLYSKFLENVTRPVTLLDGDIVRRNLSSELNFSKEHRNLNVERIGFVANEISKNRGIAICAPIAPYKSTRDKIRENIEKNGGFIEVYISTPLEVCEKRDRKGMYKKARLGLIKDFTGIDDPYEAPENPEVKIDTTNTTPHECAELIFKKLNSLGFI